MWNGKRVAIFIMNIIVLSDKPCIFAKSIQFFILILNWASKAMQCVFKNLVVEVWVCCKLWDCLNAKFRERMEHVHAATDYLFFVCRLCLLGCSVAEEHYSFPPLPLPFILFFYSSQTAVNLWTNAVWTLWKHSPQEEVL